MLHLSRAVGRALLIALPLAALAATLIQKPISAQTPKSLEGLLKESEVDYVRTKDGFFKVVMTVKNDTSLVVVSEHEVFPDKDGTYKAALFDVLVVDVPDNFKHTAAMLKKVATINDRLPSGRLSIEEKSGDVFYRSQIWLRTADANIVSTELLLAHFNHQSSKKDLQPFVEE